MRWDAAMVALFALAGCGEQARPVADKTPAPTPSSEEVQARVAAQRYLPAVSLGDATTACGLLTDAAVEDAGYRSRKTCVRAYEKNRLPLFPIVSVRMRYLTEAEVTIDDAAASDSGNDVLTLKRYPSGWRVEDG